MPIEVTTTYHKINQLTKKIKVIQGGQAAGKNYAIAQLLMSEAFSGRKVITVMSDSYDNLKDGAIQDFKNILESQDFDFSVNYNKSSHDLNIGDSVIQFRYISDNKEMAGRSKRRDILYINEANKIGWDIASTYIGRTHGIVFIDHNPDMEYWAHTEIPKIKDKDGNGISDYIIVTWRDNEFCPQSEIDFIESRKGNKQWYRVFGMGLTGTFSDRQIYTYEFCDKIPITAKRIASGMDFGVSPDPTSLIDLYIDGANLYADEVFTLNNLLPQTIEGAERPSVAKHMESIKYPKGQLIVGDSSGRTTILDLRKRGFNIIAVKKNIPVYDGIQKIRSYRLHITKTSETLKKGIESWHWKVDPNGKIIPEPHGHEWDSLAAIRYALMAHRV